MKDYSNMRTLREQEDITPDVEEAIKDCVEWFLDGPMSTEEFIDRLCDTYGGTDWELDNYDSPAARRVMNIARALKKEMTA